MFLICSCRAFTSLAQRREGDHAPQSAWWKGRAGSASMQSGTLITNRARNLRKAMSSPEVMF